MLKGWREGLLAAVLTCAPVAVLLATVPGSRGSPIAALVVGMVAGALLLMATLTFYVHWLALPRPHHGWVVSAMVVLGSQVLVGSGLGLAGLGPVVADQAGARTINLLVTAVALALVVLSARGLNGPDPLLLGLALSLILTVLQVVEFDHPTLRQPSAIIDVIMLLTIIGGYASIVTLIWRDRDLPARSRRRLAITVSLIGCALFTRTGLPTHWVSDLATAMALTGAASLWISATFILVRQTLDDQRQRSAGLEGLLLEIETSWRGSREQLHEIRSTLAGAASASRLLADNGVDAVTHDRLQRAIGSELDRLERLVSTQPAAVPGPVDLDATLDVLLASHRARGRAITWEPTGASVYASSDDVTEALNILLDNAATHGGAASTIAVTHSDDQVEIAVSDEGPGVPAEWREQIFDWGVHGSDSQGQGIGLHLARRLMSQHGGSLTLAEPGTAGSSFVIRLPAARRSEENDVRNSGHPA